MAGAKSRIESSSMPEIADILHANTVYGSGCSDQLESPFVDAVLRIYVDSIWPSVACRLGPHESRRIYAEITAVLESVSDEHALAKFQTAANRAYAAYKAVL